MDVFRDALPLTTPRLLSRTEACRELNVSLSILKTLIGHRALRVVRLGRRCLIAESELRRFIGERMAESEAAS